MADNNLKLELSRVFNAPRELVFQAWTDADQFKQWFGAAACGGSALQSVKMDARVGGKYRLQTRRADGEFYTTVGTYRAVQPPERLVFTWAFEKDGSGEEFGEVEPCEMLVTVEFRARGKQTELILTHENFASVESRDRHEQGWTRCLNELGKVVGPENQTAEAEGKFLAGTEFIITREYAAPRDLVWLACTDAKQVAQWWGPRGFTAPVCEWDAQPGNKIHVVMRAPNGTRYPMGGEFLEVDPPGRLVTVTGPLDEDGNLKFEFRHVLTLAEENGKTKLTMRSRLQKVTAPDAGRYIGGFEAGMTQSLERLADLVLEPADREIFVTRDFAAPRELVWEALTNPRHVVNWWGPRGFTTTIETMDVRPGGVWQHTMRGPDGVNYPNHSVLQEVVKPERIVYAHGGRRENGPGVNFTATWTFESLTAETTRVTLRMVFPSAAERDFVALEFGAVEGAQQTFERLGEHLANSQARKPDMPNSRQSQVASPAAR